MAWQFWRTAHNRVCRDIRSDLAPGSPRRLAVYGLIAAIITATTSAGVWYDVPMHRLLTVSVLVFALLALPMTYARRMIRYPALTQHNLEATVATLTSRLDAVGATEAMLVRLGEILHAAKQLETEDVRSEAQLGTWTSRYQTVVEGAYSQINLHISNCAANAFIAYPIMRPVYIRDSFNDQHATMRALLKIYVLKLSTMIDGYYMHLRQAGQVFIEPELTRTERAA